MKAILVLRLAKYSAVRFYMSKTTAFCSFLLSKISTKTHLPNGALPEQTSFAVGRHYNSAYLSLDYILFTDINLKIQIRKKLVWAKEIQN